MNLSQSIRAYFQPGEKRRRLLMTILGVVLCCVSVGFFRQAAFGTDPFQCMCNGLDKVIPIDFGTLYVIINVILLIIVFFMNKHYIGIATFINLFFTGYLCDLFEWAIVSCFGTPSMLVRIIYLVIGVVLMCYASALYFTADLGVSTYDSIALHLATVMKPPFKFIRIATDLICVLTGLAFGYIPGVGTIITAFFMGPLITFFNVHCAQPLLVGATNSESLTRRK